MLPWRALSIGLAGCLLTAACGGTGGTSAEGRPTVVASFYPLAFLAQRIGGTDVEVQDLTTAGTEPHDLELTPRQVGDLAQADLVLFEKGFQPAVDDAVETAGPSARVDVADVVTLRTLGEGSHGGPLAQDEGDGGSAPDPHVWLDPTLMADMARAVGAKMAHVDSTHAAAYRARTRALAGRLEALDKDYKRGLRRCERDLVVSSHASFGYLTDRYGLEQLSVGGLSPDADPTPARLADAQRVVEREDVTTIFVEPLVSPRVVTSLARDAGVGTAVLDPLEGPPAPEKGDYVSVMRDNLATLRTALGCT